MVEYYIEIRIVGDDGSAWFTKKVKGQCVPRKGEPVKLGTHFISEVIKVTHDAGSGDVTVMLAPRSVSNFEESAKRLKRLGYST